MSVRNAIRDFTQNSIKSLNDNFTSIWNLLDGRITGKNIANNTIATQNIKDMAIDSAKIGNASIQTANIQDASITDAKINRASINKLQVRDADIDRATINKLVVTTADIADAAITNAKIKDATIDNAKIQDATISTAKIKDAAIVTAKIDDAQITTAKIGTAQITTALIADESVINSKIANASITEAKIQDAQITTAKIKNASITTALIDTGAVKTAQIADGSITDAKVVNLTADKIVGNTLDTSKVTIQGTSGKLRMVNNRIQAFDNQTVPKERVSLGDVNGDGTLYGLRVRGADGVTVLLDENGVKPEGITDGSITNVKISSSADINGSKLLDNSTSGSKLVVDAITAREIAAKTVTANEIAANTITATEIAANTITAEEIKTETLTTALVTSDFGRGLNIASNASIISKVSKDSIISTINQTAETITIDANKVNISGLVTFSSLSTPGQSTIDGGNIKGSEIVGVDLKTNSTDNYAHLTDNIIELYQTWYSNAGNHNGVPIQCFSVSSDKNSNTSTLYLQAPDSSGSLRSAILELSSGGLNIRCSNGVMINGEAVSTNDVYSSGVNPPFTSGYVKYSKALSIVTVTINATSNNIGNNVVIGTLPYGFRPSDSLLVPILVVTGSGLWGYNKCGIQVGTDGTLTFVTETTESTKSIGCSFSYHI